MRIIAHRGASEAAPENTMRAFRLAREMGAHGIEIDVQASADDELVVFHDQDVQARCGRPGVVRRMTLEQLRALEVDGSGESIPTLEEVVRSRERPPIVTIEIKTYRVSDIRVADLVGRFLRALEPALRSQLVVSSFHPLALFKARRYAPEVRRALLSMSALKRPLREMWARKLVGASELHLEVRMIDRRRVERIHAAGRECVAWTVNDPERMLKLREFGVDAVMTDVPDVAAVTLEHGADAGYRLLAQRYPGFDPSTKPIVWPLPAPEQEAQAQADEDEIEAALDDELRKAFGDEVFEQAQAAALLEAEDEEAA